MTAGDHCVPIGGVVACEQCGHDTRHRQQSHHGTLAGNVSCSLQPPVGLGLDCAKFGIYRGISSASDTLLEDEYYELSRISAVSGVLSVCRCSRDRLLAMS